jgi:serine/threonine protein kinase/tetratricopeptide (TPR) repeat protein
MIGRVLGHYRVVERIGAGGMGEVYRARDTRLERDVALKILPADRLADERVRRRFRKEALALSRLSHPHIATVHDFDSQDGIDFLVMELIPGEGMDEKLRSGPLPEKEALRLGAQLARGLMAAHERGVVHRDLKPSNLRLTDEGLLKVLDFGLASVQAPVTDTSRPTETAEPAFAGTVPYMAPEQIRGAGVDPRTDVYAAGNFLYEMATGERPFAAAHGTMLTEAILHEAPPSPRLRQPALSSGLEFVILKALEKEPERRYQSAKELLLDLERLATPSVATAVPGRRERRRWPMVAAIAGALGLVLVGLAAWRVLTASPPPITSIAVLPLQNFSADSDQEFFVDGMTDALIARLAQIRSLKVISRTSVMSYKGARKPLPQIARELGVQGIVEGSVTRSGKRVRITAQLIDARQDRHLWASNYERDVTDVLALQSELARAIAGEIRAQVTAQERDRLRTTRGVDPEAYEATLRGRAALEYATRESEFRRAIGLFQSSVDKDPGYAPAWAGLGEATWGLAESGVELVAPAEVRGPAIGAVDKALALDEDLPEAHNARAVVAYDSWDFRMADREFARAVELRPGYAACHNTYGQLLSWLGRFDQARQHLEEARALDPFSPWNDVNGGAWWFSQGRYERAIEEWEGARRGNPTLWILPWAIGDGHLCLGRPREGVTAIEAAVALLPERTAAVLGTLGLAYGLAGRREDALRIRDELEKASQAHYVPPTYRACVASGVGRMDEAFQLLDRALEERTPNLPFFAHPREGINVALRRDPRWRTFIDRLRPLVSLPPGIPDLYR